MCLFCMCIDCERECNTIDVCVCVYGCVFTFFVNCVRVQFLYIYISHKSSRNYTFAYRRFFFVIHIARHRTHSIIASVPAQPIWDQHNWAIALPPFNRFDNHIYIFGPKAPNSRTASVFFQVTPVNHLLIAGVLLSAICI